MGRETEFYPSQLNPLAVRLCQSLSYIIASWVYQLQLEITETDLDRIKKLGNNRLILMPNHPTFDDGIALFLLSTRLGEMFNYLVAYESFEGILGKFLQLMGAYSIKRGLADRQSVAYTLQLLQQPRSRLVIFAEGGCSFQNDTVMNFRSGAIQFPFQTLSKIAKQETNIPDFYVVPVSLKYRYIQPMNQVIEATLKRLETHFKIHPQTTDFYARLRGVAERVLASLEKDYQINVEITQNFDWNQRIKQLRNQILERCQEELNLTFPENTPPRERVYKIQSVLESQTDISHQEFLYQSTLRLLNFDAIYDGYVAENPTSERFLDTLTRLEREVFKIDRPYPKGQRKAIIKIGDPVNLKDYFQAYKDNKTATIEDLTQTIQATVQRNIELN
jgi:hypothetical protein